MRSEESVPESAPKPGTMFADRYRIERVLGVGGMGFVLSAVQLATEQRVAIKMLLPALASDAQTVERFLREGQAAIKIQSEHIARIVEVGKLPDKTPFLVMEYLDGCDLADVIQTRGRVSFETAVDWILEACEAIAEAHAMKIIHRDLKPANLFLARKDEGEIVKVLDFGISKMSGDGNLAMTKTSTMLGSPLYMSPEQLKSSRNVDERGDIWALGVILFELICGEPPFMAETLAELGMLVLSTDAPRLSQKAPGVPRGLSDVVMTCLQKKPADRFVNLADFAEAIAPFGGPSARTSTNRISKTLGGLPSVRAMIVNTAPTSGPELLQTQVMSHALARGSASSGGFNPAATPAPVSGPSSDAPGRGSSRLLVVGGVVCAVLLVAGSVLLYEARNPRRNTEPPVVAAPTIEPPLPSSTNAGLGAPLPSSHSPPAEIASAPPSSRPAPSANVAPKLAGHHKPTGAGATSVATPTPPTAAPKPSSPSGLATSSKD